VRIRVIENDPLQDRLPRGLMLVEPDTADGESSSADNE
jgi:hypothetical protein